MPARARWPPEEIAAFWNHYRTTWTEDDLRPPMALLAVGALGTGRNEISELIFFHWSRHDPAAALAAAKDERLDHLAWHGWAAHDPRAALDAALADGKSAAEEVARTLGLCSISRRGFGRITTICPKASEARPWRD